MHNLQDTSQLLPIRFPPLFLIVDEAKETACDRHWVAAAEDGGIAAGTKFIVVVFEPLQEVCPDWPTPKFEDDRSIAMLARQAAPAPQTRVIKVP